MVSENRIAVRAQITGRVQGVAYRYWARGEAQARGLSGWVRNERDGSVAALITGPKAAVEEMVGLLADGPRAASVTEVKVENADAGETPHGFRITR